MLFEQLFRLVYPKAESQSHESRACLKLSKLHPPARFGALPDTDFWDNIPCTSLLVPTNLIVVKANSVSYTCVLITQGGSYLAMHAQAATALAVFVLVQLSGAVQGQGYCSDCYSGTASVAGSYDVRRPIAHKCLSRTYASIWRCC